jgi:hypothetical protein
MRSAAKNSVVVAASIRVDLKDYQAKLSDNLWDLHESAVKTKHESKQKIGSIDPEHLKSRLEKFGLRTEAKDLLDAWSHRDSVAYGQLLATVARWAVKQKDLPDGWYEVFKDLRTIQDALDADEGVGWDAEVDIKRILKETAQAQGKVMQDVKSAISRVEQWNGSPIRIVPMVSSTEYGDSNYLNAATSAHVYVGDDAGFTYFAAHNLDDILDAGDRDFFRDPKVEQDYFNLVRELQQPGSTSKPGKLLTLYTARPVKDRKQLEHAAQQKKLPNNIFLTDSVGEAEGYAAEYPPRDIWKVKIYEKYVTTTQQRGGMAAGNYQTMGPGGHAPVKEMILLSVGGEAQAGPAGYFSIKPLVPLEPLRDPRPGEPVGAMMNTRIKREVIAVMLRAGRTDLANAIARGPAPSVLHHFKRILEAIGKELIKRIKELRLTLSTARPMAVLQYKHPTDFQFDVTMNLSFPEDLMSPQSALLYWHRGDGRTGSIPVPADPSKAVNLGVKEIHEKIFAM